MGYPSRACEACRRRKIGCDLERPECSNCRQSGWRCSGYRDITSLVMRDETLKTAKRLGKDRAKLASTTGLKVKVVLAHSKPQGQYLELACSDSIKRCKSQALDWCNNTATPISARLDLPCEVYAETYFMKSLITVPRYTHGLSLLPLCLPNVYNRSPSYSAIHQVVRATSIMSLARADKCKQSTVRAAAIEHARALRSFRSLVEQNDNPDEIVLSASLLILYEILHDVPDATEPYLLHLRGVSAWIKQNVTRTCWTPQSLHLYRVVRLAIIKECIRDGQPIDSPFQLPESEIFDSSICSENPKPLQFALRLAALRVRAKEIFRDIDYKYELAGSTIYQVSKVLKLLKDASSMDNEFWNWFSALQRKIEQGEESYIVDLELMNVPLTELPLDQNYGLCHYLRDCRLLYIYTLDVVVQSLKCLCRLYSNVGGEKENLAFVKQLYDTSQERIQKYMNEHFSAAECDLSRNNNQKAREKTFSTKDTQDIVNVWCITQNLEGAAAIDSISKAQRLDFTARIRNIKDACW